jgi:4'-phosphopantetheinyl transferase
VDLEKIRPDFSIGEIALRYFFQREQEWLLSSPPDERAGRFYLLWVLKEAVIKADGRGLSMPLSDVEMDMGSHTVRLASGKWFVQELNIGKGYAAAIALKDAGCVIDLMGSPSY